MIWTRHGAGDKAVGFAHDIYQFDFVLMAGPKLEQRLLSKGLIRPGHYVTGVYAKFDFVRRHAAANKLKLFPIPKPIIIFNPHCKRSLTSWFRMGKKVLNILATQDRYNIVFAPHIRLFDPPTEREKKNFAFYTSLPHMLIDLNSSHSTDMTYISQAHIYLGDVSSQVTEFLVQEPRPCIFLNAQKTEWEHNPDYRFWTLGQVLDTTNNLLTAIERAFREQKKYLPQTNGVYM